MRVIIAVAVLALALGDPVFGQCPVGCPCPAGVPCPQGCGPDCQYRPRTAQSTDARLLEQIVRQNDRIIQLLEDRGPARPGVREEREAPSGSTAAPPTGYQRYSVWRPALGSPVRK